MIMESMDLFEGDDVDGEEDVFANVGIEENAELDGDLQYEVHSYEVMEYCPRNVDRYAVLDEFGVARRKDRYQNTLGQELPDKPWESVKNFQHVWVTYMRKYQAGKMPYKLIRQTKYKQ